MLSACMLNSIMMVSYSLVPRPLPHSMPSNIALKPATGVACMGDEANPYSHVGVRCMDGYSGQNLMATIIIAIALKSQFYSMHACVHITWLIISDSELDKII